MLLNYTTTIDAEQTINEIQRLLSAHSVQAMMTEYDGRQVSAVSFKLNVDGKPMGFKLPCNWRSVRAVFDDQALPGSSTRTRTSTTRPSERRGA